MTDVNGEDQNINEEIGLLEEESSEEDIGVEAGMEGIIQEGLTMKAVLCEEFYED
jgi:hypothetical protein